MKTLITAQTDAASSDSFSISSDNYQGTDPHRQGVTLRVTGGELGSGEYVTLNYGTVASPIPVNIEGNAGKVLDEDNTVCSIYGRLEDVFVTKSITSAARGVEMG